MSRYGDSLLSLQVTIHLCGSLTRRVANAASANAFTATTLPSIDKRAGRGAKSRASRRRGEVGKVGKQRAYARTHAPGPRDVSEES